MAAGSNNLIVPGSGMGAGENWMFIYHGLLKTVLRRFIRPVQIYLSREILRHHKGFNKLLSSVCVLKIATPTSKVIRPLLAAL